MTHTMKLWERVIQTRLRIKVSICEQLNGSMPTESITDAALRRKRESTWLGHERGTIV